MNQWYKGDGQSRNVVVTSRVRLARNVDGRLFESKMSVLEKRALADEVTKALEPVYLHEENKFITEDMEKISQRKALSLVEQQFISPDFAAITEGRKALLSEDGKFSIMLNEEDHMRIQGLQVGLDFEHSYDVIQKLAMVLDSALLFAYDLRLGYLTACTTNLGTGLRASVMLHLPMLERMNKLRSIREQLGKMGYTIRGTHGEGSPVENYYYQISNQITLGITEERAMRSLTEIVNYLVGLEMDLRSKADRLFIEDLVCRAYGLLSEARILSFEEMCKCLSAIRFGLSLGFLEHISHKTIDTLWFSLGDATVAETAIIENQREIDKLRADIVRQAIQKPVTLQE